MAQISHCVQGCVMHNCREREALDHLAVGRARIYPAVLAKFRVCFNNGLTMFFFSERKYVISYLFCRSLRLSYKLSMRSPRYTFNAHGQLHHLAQNLLCQHMRHDRRLWNNAGDADIPCDVIPTVFGLLFLHDAW